MSIWESIKNIMTIPDEDYEDETLDEKEDRAQGASYDEPSYTPKKSEPTPRLIKSKTVSYNQAQGQMQVVLVKPDHFEDVTSIADHLNEGKTVVLNLEEAAHDVSRRIVDFLSGVAYANHGNMRKVAKNTFIIVARGIDVMGELMLEDFDEGKIYF